MSISPKDSPLKLSAEQEAQVMKMTSVGEISAFMRQCALEQGLVQQLQGAQPGVLVDTARPERKTATIEMDGQTFEFSADTDEELTKIQLEFMRGRKNAPATTVPTKTEPARDESGRFVASTKTPEQVAAAAVLELQWKRGEISTSKYLLESGAIDEYIAKAEERAGEVEIQSWQSATETFKQGPGADWPGGDNNRIRLGKKLEELGLTDATDKVAAMTTAWNEMRKEDATQNMNAEIQKASSKAEIDSILARYSEATGIGTNAGGGLFTRR